MNFELQVFNAFHGLAGQSGLLDWLIVFIGKYLPGFLIIGAAAVLFLEKNWRRRLNLLFFAGLSLILSRALLVEILRFFYFRARPFTVLDFQPLIDHAAAPSFPSGHAAFYFALAFAILLFGHKKLGWVFVGAALLVGVARVAAGLHWPTDIAAGAAVALISILVVKWLLPRFES